MIEKGAPTSDSRRRGCGDECLVGVALRETCRIWKSDLEFLLDGIASRFADTRAPHTCLSGLWVCVWP